MLFYYFRSEDNMAGPGGNLFNLGAVPIAVMTDSYKAGHFMMYPDALKMVAYGEFRAGFGGDKEDTRIVAYGIRYLIENFVSKQWTQKDVDDAALFYSTHNAPFFTDYPFPKDLFSKFVNENNGYFPVKMQALLEGTVIHAHVPVYQITAEAPYAKLVTFLETLLTWVWYPSTVATLSRRARDAVEDAFEKSVDGGKESPLLGSKLHDFGFRGCTGAEQAIIGGCAHLLNFEGSDTMAAAYYAQFTLNNGKPVAMSVPASEHSVMTAWATEKEAIEVMIDRFGGGNGVLSIVMDSYDYVHALEEILPAVASKKIAKGGFLVLRPDSGDPAEAVLQGLAAGEKVFGVDVNQKGYKVVRGCGVIQGDGINLATMKLILEAVLKAGYSAQCVTFGMGGGLLQKVNRDTMSFATKLSHITYADGRSRAVMKCPKTDASKFSLPGILQVRRDNGIPTVYQVADNGAGRVFSEEENLLKVVYDKGPVKNLQWDDFATVRARIKAEWPQMPRAANPLSGQIQEAIKEYRVNMAQQFAEEAAAKAKKAAEEAAKLKADNI